MKLEREQKGKGILVAARRIYFNHGTQHRRTETED